MSTETWEYGAVPPIEMPAAAATTEGSAGVDFPFSFPRSRVQVLVETPALSRTEAAPVVALELRRDQGTAALTPRTVDLTLLFGVPGVTAQGMGTTMAANWAGPPTVEFLGSLSLRAQPAVVAGPAPWNLRVPFGRPICGMGRTTYCGSSESMTAPTSRRIRSTRSRNLLPAALRPRLAPAAPLPAGKFRCSARPIRVS
ncbi:MAG: hypothetical protein AAF628_15970 [Planctomycetota bacterium]